MKCGPIVALFIICLIAICRPKVFNRVQDVVVIGGGLMGSSAAWHLSDRGHDVLLLEKQDSIYSSGSSYGEARIARSNNRGNDIWSYLHNQSVKESQSLIAYLNSMEMDKYSMEDIYTTNPVTYVGRMSIHDKLASSLIRQEVDSKMAINPKEGEDKFDVLLPEDVLMQREFNLFSGTLNPQNLIAYLHDAILFKGSRVQYNKKVSQLNYDPSKGFYNIEVQDESSKETTIIRAKKVISAAGPYTGKLLENVAPYFDTLIKPQRVFLGYMKINAELYASLSDAQKNKIEAFYPVINSSKGTRAGSFFSMIEYKDEQQHPIIKIGGHFQRSEIEDLEKVWTKSLTNSEIDWCMTSTAGYFKMLKLPIEVSDIEMVDAYSCVYSLTDSEVPFITAAVGADQKAMKNCIVMSGLSGVGAKGAMSYGMIAADLMEDKTQADSMYLVSRKALGFERLLMDLK